ncbi:MAG: hypothetical protein JO111_06380, partial [Caulobacteraceae bacterium]|nr:hypothetical protein [Caulobacteraceae bacterium]
MGKTPKAHGATISALTASGVASGSRYPVNSQGFPQWAGDGQADNDGQNLEFSADGLSSIHADRGGRLASRMKMDSLAVAIVMLGCSFGAAILGMLLRRRLPVGHLDGDSRDVVKLVMGLVATMAALVVGLLVASANASHERQASELTSLSADIILLDQTLALYGSEAQPVRDSLREEVQRTHDAIWTPAGVRPENLNSTALQNAGRAKRLQVASLVARTDTQQQLKSRAFALADGIGKSRLLMFESYKNQVPLPFLAVLIFWITALFLGFGLLSRFNVTVAVTLFLGALSVSGAIFL